MSHDPRRALLRHFLAALAYRTQKALRGAPPQFADYDPGARVRRPRELLRHMTSVLGYARTFFLGGTYRAEPLDTLAAEWLGSIGPAQKESPSIQIGRAQV